MHFVEHITDSHSDMVQAMAGQMDQRSHSLVESLVLLEYADGDTRIAWKLSRQRRHFR